MTPDNPQTFTVDASSISWLGDSISMETLPTNSSTKYRSIYIGHCVEGGWYGLDDSVNIAPYDYGIRFSNIIFNFSDI